MKIEFACPSCAAAGTVDASAAGRSARCKHCGHRFTIPTLGADSTEPEVFALQEPAEETPRTGYAVMGPVETSTFAPARGVESAAEAPRRPKKSGARSATRTAGRRTSRGNWPIRLAWAGGTVAIALAAVALFAPSGLLIAACALMIIGCVLILVGFGVGAYGAFSEDFIYGFFYLIIPLYTAYYMVTRWDDLWIWFACMTTGFGLVLLGIELARWGGVAA
jgi:predicted Zn finger-like uncharacterized protein